MDENTTVINLDELEKSGHLEEAELIYRDAYDSLCQTIIQKVKRNVEACKKGITDLVSQPCFFINGGRGSGKTTLLRAVRHKLCSENAIEGTKIHELAAIDPTELAETENFFIHILGRVQKNLSDMKSERILNDVDKAHLRNAYTSIRKMSKGLGLLVRRPEDGGNSSDAGFFVQQRVEDCVSGLELKQEFAKLVETLCKLFKVNAMLVTVDDADMNFNKCSEVFETVRKYLINDRMVFIFAGDLKLYTMVARGMHLVHFGDMAWRHDKSRESHRFALMDNLEDQYVMKLLPIENRVELTDFSAVLSRNPNVKYRNSKGEVLTVALSTYLKEFLERKVKVRDFDIWVEYIKNLSTRSALQLLSYWNQHGSAKWRDGIRMVVAHSILKHHVDALAIQRGAVHDIASQVIMHARKLGNNVLHSGLLPWYGDISLQMVSFYLASEIAHHVRNLRAMLIYYLSVFPILHESLKLSKKEFRNDRSLTYNSIGADSTALMLPPLNLKNGNNKMFGNGVVPLLSQNLYLDCTEKERISVQRLVAKLRELTKENSSEVFNSIIAINVAMSRVVDKGTCVYCLSVYNLMAKVVQLLSVDMSDENDVKNKLTQILSENFILIPTASRNVVVEHARVPDGFIGIGEEKWINFKFLSEYKKEMEAFVEDIKTWLIKAGEDFPLVHPDIYQSSWAYFYRECLLLTNEAKVKGFVEDDLVQAGSLFSRYVMGFVASMIHVQKANDKQPEPFQLLQDCPLVKIWLNGLSPSIASVLNDVNVGPIEVPLNKKMAEELCNYKVNREYSECKKNIYTNLELNVREYENYHMEHWRDYVTNTARDMFLKINIECLRQNKESNEKYDETTIKSRCNMFVQRCKYDKYLKIYSDFVNNRLQMVKLEVEAELMSRTKMLCDQIIMKIDRANDLDDFENRIINRSIISDKKNINSLERRSMNRLSNLLDGIRGDAEPEINRELEDEINSNLNKYIKRKKGKKSKE